MPMPMPPRECVISYRYRAGLYIGTDDASPHHAQAAAMITIFARLLLIAFTWQFLRLLLKPPADTLIDDTGTALISPASRRRPAVAAKVGQAK